MDSDHVILVKLLAANDLVNAIDNKLQTDMAILDFSKAFDKVAHTTSLSSMA